MKGLKHILCVIEAGAACQCALERAVALAENNQASLTVVAVAGRIAAGIGLPEHGLVPDDLQAEVVDAHARELETLTDAYRGRIRMDTRVLVGTPFLEVIRDVLRNGHDLVIKCAEPADGPGWFFGSDDMHLLRKCPCPVWLVKPESPKSYRRILAAVDVANYYPPAELQIRQALNDRIMEMACSLSVSEFAELHVARAWDAIGESAMRHGAFASRPEDVVDGYVEAGRRWNGPAPPASAGS